MMPLLGTKALALTTGAVLAVGFAAWSITRTLGDGQVLASAGHAGTGTPVSRKHPTTGLSTVEAPRAQRVRPRLVVAPLEVAPDADPFTELAIPGQAPPSVSSAGVRSGGPASTSLPSGAGPVVRVGPPPMPLPGPNPSNRTNRVPILPDAGTRPFPGVPGPPVVQPHEPRIVGTMLGEIPSAVVSVGENVVIARVGDSIGEWKVIAISHSRVRLRHAATGRDVTVRVGDAEAGVDEPTDKGVSFPSTPMDPAVLPRP